MKNNPFMPNWFRCNLSFILYPSAEVFTTHGLCCFMEGDTAAVQICPSVSFSVESGKSSP